MPWVWISIGSNQDRDRCIRGSVAQLQARFGPLRLSPVYESDPVGFQGQPFYNLVAGFACDWELSDLLALLRTLEDEFGRERQGPKFSPRTLDLDLLTYGDQVVDRGPVRLPRDEITRYAFVLRPLADVAGDECHPLLGTSYGALWAEFDASAQPLRPIAFWQDIPS